MLDWQSQRSEHAKVFDIGAFGHVSQFQFSGVPMRRPVRLVTNNGEIADAFWCQVCSSDHNVSCRGQDLDVADRGTCALVFVLGRGLEAVL